MKRMLRRLCIELPQLAYVLSGKRPMPTCTLYVYLVYISIYWKYVSHTPFRVAFLWNGNSFHFDLKDSTDIASLLEIFIDGEYDWKLDAEPDVVFDLGACFGDTALYYSMLYPQATVVAVEPSQESYERLVAHAAQRNGIVPVQAVLSAVDGTSDFFVLADNNLGHSTIKRHDAAEKITVPSVSLTSLLQQYAKEDDVILIKFDIEGGEGIIFDVFPELQKKYPRSSLIGEVHFDLLSKSKDDITHNLSGCALDWRQLQHSSRAILRVVIKKA